MGSQQSSQYDDSASSKQVSSILTDVNASVEPHHSDSQQQYSKPKKSPPSHLKGFQLIEYNCRKNKKDYNICYKKKHSAFVVLGKENKNEANNKELDCDELFEKYKDCIYKGMLQDRRKRGLPEPKEDSALGDYKLYSEDDDEIRSSCK